MPGRLEELPPLVTAPNGPWIGSKSHVMLTKLLVEWAFGFDET